jgi:hypothetical protein
MAGSTLFLQFQKSSITGLACRVSNGSYIPKSPIRISLDGANGENALVDVGLKLQQALRQSGYGHLRECILILHRQDIAVLQVEFPSGSEGEIESMLALELPELLPLGKHEICYGWERLGTTPEGKALIEVYWTPLSVITAFLDVLKEAHLDITGIFSGLHVYRKSLIEEQDGAPLSFIRAYDNDIEIFRWNEHKECQFSHGKQIPTSVELNHQQDHIELLPELKRAIASCQRQFPGERDIPCIFVGENIFLETLQPCFEVLPHDNPIAKRAENLLARMDCEDTDCYLPLLAALDPIAEIRSHGKRAIAGHSCNMLPMDIRRKREETLLRNLKIHTAFLIVGILALSIANLWFYTFHMENQLVNNNARIQQLKPIVKDVEAMEERIASIRNQIEYALSPIDALKEINEVLAENSRELDGLFLDKLGYDAEGEIRLEGHAKNAITPWALAKILDRTDAFRVIRQPRISYQMQGATRGIRFQMGLCTAIEQFPNGSSEAGAT